MPVKAGYLIAGAGGLLLLWSGFKGKKWSDTLRQTLTTGNPQTTTTAYPITSVTATGITATNGGGGYNGGPVPPPSGARARKNQVIGRVLAAAYGWSTGSEWNALVRLWNQESGWNNYARNSSSGAYGIPQSLPASKMGPLANPPISSATAQIRWGLSYIKSRYGDPNAAERHEIQIGWY